MESTVGSTTGQDEHVNELRQSAFVRPLLEADDLDNSCQRNSKQQMLLCGLLAKKAVDAGLTVKPYIKTSLSPGSGVVTYYLRESGVMPYLSQLGFDVVGYGCMTCIGNSGPLPEPVVEAITQTVNESWNALAAPSDTLYYWNPKSTYIKSPPFFENLV
ncbi:Cytoplasmic aconitate hydratase [Myotis brandtii]|uniref:Cytoplasmic aconitate hydratase n=1 Tax=Myotis brandtii TaxID=109478 RepID=S7NPU7_MYOBR|nr:Cytoplasmic aconitate hydratase [Myotis brandtii]